MPRLLGPYWSTSLNPTGKRRGDPEKASEGRALVLINDCMRKTSESKKTFSSGPLNQFAGNWLYRTFPKSSKKLLSILRPRSLSDVYYDHCEFGKLL